MASRDSLDLEMTLHSAPASICLSIVYTGAEIYCSRGLDDSCVDTVSQQFGGIEFAISRKIVEGHGGSIEIGLSPDAKHQIDLKLPTLR